MEPDTSDAIPLTPEVARRILRERLLDSTTDVNNFHMNPRVLDIGHRLALGENVPLEEFKKVHSAVRKDGQEAWGKLDKSRLSHFIPDPVATSHEADEELAFLLLLHGVPPDEPRWDRFIIMAKAFDDIPEPDPRSQEWTDYLADTILLMQEDFAVRVYAARNAEWLLPTLERVMRRILELETNPRTRGSGGVTHDPGVQ